MQRHGWTAWAVLAGLGLSLFLGGGAFAQGIAPPSPPKAGQEIKPGEYWIGVQVQYPVPDQVRAQLSIPKDEGILVEGVGPAAPADGKLQPYDVIVKAGGKTLKSPSDLVSAVDAAKGGKLPLDVLRGGKAIKIEVTPVKRPPQREGDFATEILKAKPHLDSATLAEVWGQAGDPMRFYALRPGWMLRPGTPLAAPLPANLTITVTRQGDQPAKIVVNRDDKTWEVTEKELDKLPNDIRPHVEQMLGRGPGRIALESLTEPGTKLEFGELHLFSPDGPKDHKPGAAPPPPPKVVLQPRLERQLDEIRQQLDQLRKTLDELRAQQAAPKTEKK